MDKMLIKKLTELNSKIDFNGVVALAIHPDDLEEIKKEVDYIKKLDINKIKQDKFFSQLLLLTGVKLKTDKCLPRGIIVPLYSSYENLFSLRTMRINSIKEYRR